MNLFSEHRLARYIKTTDKTRYNARTAEANAEQQNAQRAAQVSLNQSTGQTTSDPNFQQAAKVPTSQALQTAQTVYNTPGEVSLNTQTGQTTAVSNDPRNPTGFIPEGAKVGADRNMGIEDQVRQQYADMGVGDPATINDAISKALDVENQKLKQQDILAEREQKRAANAAAVTAAGAKAGAKADEAMQSNAPIQGSSKMDTVATMLDGIIDATGDPMGQVTKAMILQDLQDREDAIANAEASYGASVDRAEDQNTAVQNLLDKYLNIHRQNNDKYTALLDETRDSQQKYLAEQEQRDLDRLAWEGDRETQKLARQKTAQLLSQSIQNALGGGAFSGAASEQLAATEREWDTAISDLAKEYSFKKADVSAFYTQKYIDTNNQFNMDVYNAARELDEKIEGYSIQGFNSLQAMENAKTAAANDYRTAVDTAKKDYYTKISGYVKEIRDTLEIEAENKIKREDKALDRIDYLLKNYPRESVAEAIKELGKDVTSFDVQALIDNPTLAEIQKAEAAMAKRSSGGGGGYAMSFLPPEMQEPAQPEVSFDDFMLQKINEMEAESMQSFSPEKRAQLMLDNAEEWEQQYDAAYLAGSRTKASSQATADITAQFGQPVVDAARSILDGTYGGTNPVKTAAASFKVPENQVATALVKLRQTGDIAVTSVLTPDQQKAWNGLRKGLENDPYYKTYNGAKLAIGRIEAALTQQNGISDIAAINGFQNGIVDPNATVRSEDVGLIQSAMSWADSVDLEYWKGKVVSGDKLPQSMREQMAQTARAITAAYERAYLDQTLIKYQQEIQQAGLPQSVLQQYGSPSKATTVDPSVSSFVDSLQF